MKRRFFILCLVVIIVLTSEGGLAFLDGKSDTTITPNSLNFRLLGQAGGHTNAVAVQGNYAYIGTGLSVVVLDILDPANPIQIGKTTPMTDIVEDLDVFGNYLYAADGAGGMYIFDISSPANPTKTGFIGTPGVARRIKVSETYAYVLTRDTWNGFELVEGGLFVFDISNPFFPTEVEFWESPGHPNGLEIYQNYAFVAAEDSGLRIINISDPTTLQEEGYLNPPGTNYYRTVVVKGSYAYVGNEANIVVIDISNIATPVELNELTIGERLVAVSRVGNNLFFADETYGLSIVNIFNPTTPTFVGTFPSPGEGTNVAAAGTHAFLTNRKRGLRIYNVSNPDLTFEEGSFNILGSPFNIVKAIDHVFVGDREGIMIFDVVDSSNPELAGFGETPSRVWGIAVNDQYAYVGTQHSGLRIFDIATPVTPTEAGYFETYANVVDIAISANTAYLTHSGDGWSIIDITAPISPTEITHLDTPSRAYGVSVDNNTAYITAGNQGFYIVDVSNPISSTIIGSYTPAWANFYSKVEINEGIVYIADSNGLVILDISDPSAPSEVGFYAAPGQVSNIDIEMPFAYIADHNEGIRVVEISDPTSPLEVGFYQIPGVTQGVTVNNGVAYISNDGVGLLTIEHFEPWNLYVPIVKKE
jgi:hypothetical protein